MKIALIHNLKPASKDSSRPADYYSECDSQKTVDAIAQVIQKAGHTVLPVEADRDLPAWLAKTPVEGTRSAASLGVHDGNEDPAVTTPGGPQPPWQSRGR